MKYKTTSEEDDEIGFLKEFQNAIVAWDSEEYPDPQELRSWINQNLRRVKQILHKYGCSLRMTISPPPAIGGMIMRGVDPFDMIFNRPYMQSLVPVMCDAIDQAIGVIRNGEIHAKTSGKKQEHKPVSKSKTKVFVVHGRDNEAKLDVARLLKRLELEAIILHEQASKGRTVIEKIEDCSNVAFAVVILSPDDVGSLATEATKLNPRARQNVILELGYMVAKLGRSKVCALVKSGVEIPSDFDGVVYVSMDAAGAWKFELGKELKEAGFSIDMNKIK